MRNDVPVNLSPPALRYRADRLLVAREIRDVAINVVVATLDEAKRLHRFHADSQGLAPNEHTLTRLAITFRHDCAKIRDKFLAKKEEIDTEAQRLEDRLLDQRIKTAEMRTSTCDYGATG
tara:strand:+ start:640 stop:999 length:360 start_codon:yes stop_codon:yes gene_type:complete